MRAEDFWNNIEKGIMKYCEKKTLRIFTLSTTILTGNDTKWMCGAFCNIVGVCMVGIVIVWVFW